MSAEKLSAYQTLHECLRAVAVMASPIAPFYADQLHRDLTGSEESVHLATFPTSDASVIDVELEARMALAQQISSQVLSLRKREGIRVRQPLRRILLPALGDRVAERIEKVDAIIRSEVNIKEITLIRDAGDSEVTIVKKVKPDFKAMGPRFGKRMKAIAAAVSALDADSIALLEKDGSIEVDPQDGQGIAQVDLADVEVLTEDIPGWLVSSAGGVTVALDITLDDSLRAEG